MNQKIKCPSCGTSGKIYGLPYGLPIGDSSSEPRDVYGTILIHCEECGAVLGGFRDNPK